LTLEEKKEIFRHLLGLIFFDDCQDIGDERIISFYFYLLDSLETTSEVHISKENDDFFVVESVVRLLSDFHNLDDSVLLHIAKGHDNFKEALMEQTGMPPEFVDEAIERLLGDFQDIKNGYLFIE